MRKNAFLNELLFELQKIVQKGIIKGGTGPDEENEKDIAIAIDAASEQPSSAVASSTVVATGASNSNNIPNSPSLLEPRLTHDQITSVKTLVEGVVANLQKYLNKDIKNMTQNDLQTNGFTSEQIKAIQKMQKKNKPIEKEEIKGEIILGTSGEADAIVLDKTALVNKQSLTNDDIAIY